MVDPVESWQSRQNCLRGGGPGEANWDAWKSHLAEGGSVCYLDLILTVHKDPRPVLLIDTIWTRQRPPSESEISQMADSTVRDVRELLERIKNELQNLPDQARVRVLRDHGTGCVALAERDFTLDIA